MKRILLSGVFLLVLAGTAHADFGVGGNGSVQPPTLSFGGGPNNLARQAQSTNNLYANTNTFDMRRVRGGAGENAMNGTSQPGMQPNYQSPGFEAPGLVAMYPNPVAANAPN